MEGTLANPMEAEACIRESLRETGTVMLVNPVIGIIIV
jgi:hypothetical protein